jgi:hypothetical protein
MAEIHSGDSLSSCATAQDTSRPPPGVTALQYVLSSFEHPRSASSTGPWALAKPGSWQNKAIAARKIAADLNIVNFSLEILYR